MTLTQEEQQGRQMTVTYTVSEEHAGLNESQARELISSNAPAGFDVQNIELSEKQES